MTITLAQAVKDFDAGTIALYTSLAGAYGSNNTLGNLLVLALSAGQNTTGAQVDPVSVLDTAGNTWLKAFRQTNVTGTTNPGCEWIYYVPSCKAGANTVTVTFASSSQQFISFNIYEFHSSVAGTWTIDQTGGATSASTISKTASQAPSAALGVTSNWTSQPTGVASGWSIASNPTGNFTASGYDILTTAVAFAPGFTPNVTSSDSAVAVTNFYISSGGATTPSTQSYFFEFPDMSTSVQAIGW